MRALSSEQLVLSASFLRAEQHDGDYVLSPEADSALTRCLNSGQGQGPSDDGLDAGNDRNVFGLDAEFDAMVAGVDAGLAPAADYADCMREAGTPLSNFEGEGEHSFTSTRLTLETEQAPPSDKIPVGDEPVSAEWREFLSIEHTLLVNDAACRADVYDIGIERIRPLLPKFAQEHAKQLFDLDAHWEGILAEAVSRGFVPARRQQAPSVGD
jgi:hypothetical protein